METTVKSFSELRIEAYWNELRYGLNSKESWINRRGLASTKNHNSEKPLRAVIIRIPIPQFLRSNGSSQRSSLILKLSIEKQKCAFSSMRVPLICKNPNDASEYPKIIPWKTEQGIYKSQLQSLDDYLSHPQLEVSLADRF